MHQYECHRPLMTLTVHTNMVRAISTNECHPIILQSISNHFQSTLNSHISIQLPKFTRIRCLRRMNVQSINLKSKGVANELNLKKKRNSMSTDPCMDSVQRMYSGLLLAVQVRYVLVIRSHRMYFLFSVWRLFFCSFIRSSFLLPAPRPHTTYYYE